MRDTRLFGTAAVLLVALTGCGGGGGGSSAATVTQSALSMNLNSAAQSIQQYSRLSLNFDTRALPLQGERVYLKITGFSDTQLFFGEVARVSSLPVDLNINKDERGYRTEFYSTDPSEAAIIQEVLL